MANPYASMHPSAPRGVSGSLSAWVQILFWVAAGASLAAATTATLARSAFETAVSSTTGFGDVAAYTAADRLFGFTNLLFVGVSLALLVVLIIWTWQGCKAAEWLNPGPRKWSSGWAIGGWFVPFGNIVIPKKVIDETERIATAPRSQGHAVGWQKGRTSPIGWFWWGLWILGNAVLTWARLQTTGADSALGADAITSLYTTWTFGYVVLAASAVCGALFVRQLSRRLTGAALLQPSHSDLVSTGTAAPHADAAAAFATTSHAPASALISDAGVDGMAGYDAASPGPGCAAPPPAESASSPLPDAPWTEPTGAAMVRCDICTDLLPATATRCPRCGKERQPARGRPPAEPAATAPAAPAAGQPPRAQGGTPTPPPSDRVEPPSALASPVPGSPFAPSPTDPATAAAPSSSPLPPPPAHHPHAPAMPAGTPTTAAPAKRGNNPVAVIAVSAGLLVVVCLLAVTLLGRRTSADSTQRADGAYPAAFERDFMSGCTQSGASPSQCRCTLDTIEAMYPKEDIVSLSVAIQNNGAYPPELTSAIQSRCR